jgi:hypothetical protein
MRFDHQSYDAIEALAAKPGSGIKLTDRLRPNCMTCAEGKQKKNCQSKTDTGENSPIDRVGAVICSDLKGPITPADREKPVSSEYHRSQDQLLPLIFTKTKDEAAKKFMHFVGHFKRRFGCNRT